jgi:diacylglycerol kinase (ATP)
MSETLVVLNPVAGHSDPEALRHAVEEHFHKRGAAYELYETSGDGRVADVVRQALERGVDTVVAAGGDGTVSAVATGLGHSDARLAIVPVGTGNALARDLGIPQDVDQALELLAGRGRIQVVDALHVAKRVLLLNVGAGISAQMMRDADSDQKRRWGRIAYLWVGLGRFLQSRMRHFQVTVDGQIHRVHATEVMALNSAAIGAPYLRWGEKVRPDDGQVDVYAIRARSARDYVRLAWDMLLGRWGELARVQHWRARDRVLIHTEDPVPVQGDGDLLGHTPVDVRIAPRSVHIVVPESSDSEPTRRADRTTGMEQYAMRDTMDDGRSR